MNELQSFRSEVPSATDEAMAARLRVAFAAEQPPARASRYGRRLILVGALTTAAAVGITVVQNIEFGTAPLGPIANAQDLADRATVRMSAQTDLAPRPDQWLYLKERGGDQPEQWLRLDGFGSAYMTKGKFEVHTLNGAGKAAVQRIGIAGMDGAVRVGANDEGDPRGINGVPDLAYLRSLPTEPRALLQKIKNDLYPEQRASGGADPGPSPSPSPSPSQTGTPRPGATDHAVFAAVTRMLGFTILQPRLSATLYRVLALLPEVGVDSDVVDAAGRHGVAFKIDEIDGTKQIILDKNTYRLLGWRSGAMMGDPEGPLGKRRPYVRFTARLATVIVDRPGQRS